MACYLYKCKECEQTFEISCSWSTLLTMYKRCPHCGSEYVARKYTPVIAMYKGKGFYNTDKQE